jgi:hypothetical protein
VRRVVCVAAALPGHLPSPSHRSPFAVLCNNCYTKLQKGILQDWACSGAPRRGARAGH